MKPTKNRVYCPDCGRNKMLFKDEKQANTFIKFNKEIIEREHGYAPCRVYFCQACCGYHITSDPKEREPGTSRTDRIINMYNEMKRKPVQQIPKQSKIREDPISENELREKLLNGFKYLEIKLTPESEDIIRNLEVVKNSWDKGVHITPIILLNNEDRGSNIGKIYNTKEYFIKNYNKSKVKVDIMGVYKNEDYLYLKISVGLPHATKCTYLTVSPYFPETLSLDPSFDNWEPFQKTRLVGKLEIV